MRVKADYEGFILHLREWDLLGIPYGKSDLSTLAAQYNTPIPK
jgi:hypothetical protein